MRFPYQFEDAGRTMLRLKLSDFRLILCMTAAAMLAGCVSERKPETASQPARSLNPAQAKAYAWARVDGQRMADNADLSARAQVDLAACKAETPPVAEVGVRGESCMKERGYYVRELDP